MYLWACSQYRRCSAISLVLISQSQIRHTIVRGFAESSPMIAMAVMNIIRSRLREEKQN